MPENIAPVPAHANVVGSPRAGVNLHRAELTCPITWERMPDAVVLVGDGNTYSRQGLVSWFAPQLGEELLAPKSNVPLPKLCLVPNVVVRRLVAAESAAPDAPDCPSVSERGVCLATLDAWDQQAASLPLPTQRRLLQVQAHLLFKDSKIPPELLTLTDHALPQAWAAIIDGLPESLRPRVKLACQAILAPAGDPTRPAAISAGGPAAAPVDWSRFLLCAAALGILMFAREHLKSSSISNQRACSRWLEAPKDGNAITLDLGSSSRRLLTVTLPVTAAAYAIGGELARALGYRPAPSIRRIARFGLIMLLPVLHSAEALFHLKARRGCIDYRHIGLMFDTAPFNFFLESQEAYLSDYGATGRLESIFTTPLFCATVAYGFLLV